MIKKNRKKCCKIAHVTDTLAALIALITFGEKVLIAFIQYAEGAMQPIKNQFAILTALLIVAGTLILVVGIIAFSVIIVLGPRL